MRTRRRATTEDLGLTRIFIAGLALPHAFNTESTLFAITYAVVRILHGGGWLARSATRSSP